MSREKLKTITVCYFVFLGGFLLLEINGDRNYPASFWFFFMLVGIVIGPNLLGLYTHVLRLQETVERLQRRPSSPSQPQPD